MSGPTEHHPESRQPRQEPLPEPFPEYLLCPHCGEPEVEVWCYQDGVNCHQCGKWIPHALPSRLGSSPLCRQAEAARGAARPPGAEG